MTAPVIADEHPGPALQRYPVLAGSDFTKMTTPALVIGGDKDLNPVFSTRLSYRRRPRQVAHRPAGRAWLRASTTQFVVRDFAAASVPRLF